MLAGRLCWSAVVAGQLRWLIVWAGQLCWSALLAADPADSSPLLAGRLCWLAGQLCWLSAEPFETFSLRTPRTASECRAQTDPRHRTKQKATNQELCVATLHRGHANELCVANSTERAQWTPVPSHAFESDAGDVRTPCCAKQKGCLLGANPDRRDASLVLHPLGHRCLLQSGPRGDLQG